MPDTNPVEAGSAAARIATHLQANPSAALSRHDVGLLINVAIGAVDPLLDAGVVAGLLTIANDMDRGRVWRAGPRLKFWTPPATAPAAAPAPAPKAPAPAAKKDPRGGKRVRLPPLNPADFPVRNDVPPPLPKFSRRGETSYDAMLSEMTAAPGLCRVGLPASHRGAVTKAAQSYLKNRPELAKRMTWQFRDMHDGTFGIWSMARPAKQAA